MTGSRTSSARELFVSLHRDAGVPLYRQLEQELRDAVRSGRLAPDSTLPSTRALADQLGVARGVVVEAYEQLLAEGYLASRPGGTTRVAHVLMPEPRPVAPATPAQFEFDFRPGRPDLDEFPRGAWLRSVRRVLNEAPAQRLGYLDGRGMPELRSALATYLNRARGTCIAAEDLLISTGFAQGVYLLAKALRAAGVRRIGVEDPWHPEYRDMVVATGLEVIGIPVDDAGIRVELLDDARLGAVVVTPAHQYPTGSVLPPERRAALIKWADRHDAIIVEDDYDSEFRYDREPIGAMQGLCACRVAYAGTASKVLAPGLRLGWVAPPARLMEAMATAKIAADQGSSALDQLALADFVERGELDRHLRRMRGVYRSRRDIMLAALDRHLPLLRPVGASAGLHVLTWLPPNVDEAAFVRAAEVESIGLIGVSTLRAQPGGPGGVVFGYGSVDGSRIEEGVARLAAVA